MRVPQQHEIRVEALELGLARKDGGAALLAAGEFGAGSMRPKVEAAVSFIEHGGERSTIAALERARADRRIGHIGYSFHGPLDDFEKILAGYPRYERVRLVTSGTEAVMTALRIAEEFGILGSVLVIGLFATLCYFGLQAAVRSRDAFGAILAGGTTAWLSVQACINIGGVVGVMPVTGLTLPFISYGGSSLFMAMAASGLLLNVARNMK